MSEIQERAIVVSANNKNARIRILADGSCSEDSGCPLKNVCGRKEIVVEVENTINAKEGQLVKVEIKNTHFYNALFLIFILPLILIISGYLLGIKLFKTENAGFIAIGVGLVIWIFVLGFTFRFYKPSYRLIEILE
jgi:sigma-E factor negative regulatory protein RseC